MNRSLMSAAILALGLVACGDDPDKPAVGDNVSTNNTAVNNTAVNNTAVNNTAVNNTSVNNTSVNNTSVNNNTPTDCGAPNTEAALGLESATLPGPYAERTDTTYYEGVAYGEDQLNAFDIMMPDSDSPTPLIIFIHGGGFTGGSRDSGFQAPARVNAFLDAGFAYASISYRLLQPQGETEGVIKSLKDSRRALQFIRQHAPDFNIDPDRIGLAGVSAGAGTSMWIGMGDEACDTTTGDPTDGISTRVQAMAAIETQATYDLVRWETDVYAEGYPIVTLQNITGFDASFFFIIGQFYGLGDEWMNLDDLYEEPMVSYRAEVDMLAMASSDDPPLYLQNDLPDEMPAGLNLLLHHPLHADVMYETATAAGMTRVEIKTVNNTVGESANWGEFMLDAL